MNIEVRVLLDAPVSRVWKALTDPIQMRQWYFDNIPDFRPEIGFRTQFPVKAGGRTFTHLWEVIRIKPEREITYSWQYAEYPGNGMVTFNLRPEGTKTRLKLMNEGLETFPQDIPEFSPESCRGGWQYFLQGQLVEYLSD